VPSGKIASPDAPAPSDPGNGVVVKPPMPKVVSSAPDVVYYTGSKVDLALARYNADGSLDSTFGTGGQVATDLGGSNQAIKGLVLEPDGKLVVAGVYAPAGPSEFFIGRYSALRFAPWLVSFRVGPGIP
jgi:hypothetical protein